MFKKFKDNPYWKATMTLLIAGGILIVFNNWIEKNQLKIGLENINSTLAPVYIGVICAFLLCPVYNWVVRKCYAGMTAAKTLDDKEKRRRLTTSRIIATVAAIVIVIAFVMLLAYSMLPQIISSSVNLAETLPERLASLSDWLRTHFARFPQLAIWVDDVAKLGAKDIVNWIQENLLGENAMSIATMISSGVMTAVNTLVDIIVGLLIMIYLLNYKETLFAMCRKFIAATCSKKRQDGMYEFVDIFNETFVGFIVGRIIDSAIIGLLTYVVLIICKIPFAPMISVIVGVTNVIPFFGPFIGAIPSVLILMLEDPMKALWFIVIIFIIQQLDGNVIGPKIVGNAIGIGSFWVLIAVLIGGGMFGFKGMVFGVPVFAVIYRYVNKLVTRRLYKDGKSTHTADYFTLEQFGIDASEVHLETYKRKEKSVRDRFRKVENDHHSEKVATDNDELEKIKEKIARELLK